jgi:hypothetical protein
MADAIFEYIDKNGKTRRVDDIYKVPEQYRGNVLVIGLEPRPQAEGGEGGAKTQESQQVDGGFGSGGFDLHNLNPPKSTYAALIAAFLFLRTKNYLAKCLLGGSIFLWAAYYGGQWFANSDLMKTQVDQMAEDGKKSPLLNKGE